MALPDSRITSAPLGMMVENALRWADAGLDFDSILEGIQLLNEPHLRELMDVSIFMDTPLDICLIRRLVRDVQERGRTMESVLKQYQNTVRPMFLQFIEPSKQYADVIVPRGGRNRIAIDMLKARILHMLQG